MKKIKLKKDKYASDETIDSIAELLSIFGDSTRCRIIAILFKSPKNVSEIAEELNMTVSAISHSIRILRQAKIVKSKKEGRIVIYSLGDEHIFKIFEMAKEHIEEWKKHITW